MDFQNIVRTKNWSRMQCDSFRGGVTQMSSSLMDYWDLSRTLSFPLKKKLLSLKKILLLEFVNVRKQRFNLFLYWGHNLIHCVKLYSQKYKFLRGNQIWLQIIYRILNLRVLTLINDLWQVLKAQNMR